MRNAVLLIGILLLFVCKASAQDSFFDALEKGLAPHDGSLIDYQRDSPEGTARSNIAEKMTAEAFLLLEKEDFDAAERRFREACAAEIPDGRAQAWAQLGWAELCERQGRYSDS